MQNNMSSKTGICSEQNLFSNHYDARSNQKTISKNKTNDPEIRKLQKPESKMVAYQSKIPSCLAMASGNRVSEEREESPRANYSFGIEEDINSQRKLESYTTAPVNNNVKFFMSSFNSRKDSLKNILTDKTKAKSELKQRLNNESLEIRENLLPGEATERSSIPFIPESYNRPQFQLIPATHARKSVEISRRSSDFAYKYSGKRFEEVKVLKKSRTVTKSANYRKEEDIAAFKEQNDRRDPLVSRVRSDLLISEDESSVSQSESQVHEIYSHANLLETLSEPNGQPKRVQRLSKFAIEAQGSNDYLQDALNNPSITIATNTQQQLDRDADTNTNIIKTVPVVSKNTETNSPTLPQNSSFTTKKDPKKHWLRLSTVFRSISLLRNHEVEKIDTVERMNDQISQYKLRVKDAGGERSSGKHVLTVNALKSALGDIKRTQTFCQCAALGSEENIRKMSAVLQNDPRKNLYDVSDPNHTLNRKNLGQESPLYIASKNGNLQVVKFLVERQAYIKCGRRVETAEEEEDLPLTVAARWGHARVVEYLLDKAEYTKKELNVAIQQSDRPDIKSLIKSYLNYKKNSKKKFLRTAL